MSLRVLLAKPGHSRHYVVAPNLGLGYLATALRRNGHAPAIFHGGMYRNPADAFRRALSTLQPHVVGLQLFSHETRLAADYVSDVRRLLPDAVVVAGGAHPSADPEGTFEVPGADYVIRGEGEQAFPALLRALQEAERPAGALEAVGGLVWQDGDERRCNPQGFPEPLDDLGFPCWDLMDPRAYPAAPHGTFARHFPVAPIITSRGCPFGCSFCAAAVISGRRVRMRSAENVVEEVTHLVKSYGVREIHFEDDNLAYDPAHLASVCEAILERDLRVAWSCPNGVRVERIDGPLARLMERAGCYSLAVGIESGSQRILDAMSKGTTVEHLEEKLRLIAQATRIRLTGFFLIGVPGETRDDIEATVQFALRLPLDKALFAFALPHPGSKLHGVYREARGTEPIPCEHLYCQSQVPYFCPDDMTLGELFTLHRSAYRRFYLRPGKLLALMGEMRHPAQLKAVTRRLVPLVHGGSSSP
jgi:anaerobic magnesium-protoporphyrin IX monomethyl ester cyclase